MFNEPVLIIEDRALHADQRRAQRHFKIARDGFIRRDGRQPLLGARKDKALFLQQGNHRTVIALLEEKGFVFARAEQRLTAVAADEAIARYLEVPLGAPLICMKRAVFDDQDRLVEHIQIYYDPDLFEYRVGLSRESGDSSPQWVPRL